MYASVPHPALSASCGGGEDGLKDTGKVFRLSACASGRFTTFDHSTTTSIVCCRLLLCATWPTHPRELGMA